MTAALIAAALAPLHGSFAAWRASGAHETVIYSFGGGADGVFPEGGIIADVSGALYSTTQYGGDGCSGGCGTAFKLTPSVSGYTKTTLYQFHGGSEGAYPEAGFISDVTGALYGTLISGGLSLCRNGCGTVFKLTPSGSTYNLQVLYAFRGGADGNGPWAGLAMDRNGALYGTTLNGGGAKKARCRTGTGLVGCGIVYKLTPSASGYVESVLYAFKGDRDGGLPFAGIVIGNDGSLYGTSSLGGAPSCSCGTVFKLTPAGSSYVESTIYRFQGGSDGATSFANLIIDANGTLYGTTAHGGGTSCGGGTGCGTVFALIPQGNRYVERILYAFVGGLGDGAYPDAPVALGGNGQLYGTTQYGGPGLACQSGGCGVVFVLTPKGSTFTESVVHAFAGGSDGYFPQDGVFIGGEGELYGTAASGGGTNSGIVFSISGA